MHIIGLILTRLGLQRLARTEVGSRTMPYKLLLIPLGLIVGSYVLIAILNN